MGLRTALLDESSVEVVGETADGASCIERLRNSPVDVLLLDITLPVVDGYAVLAWVAGHQPALHSIVLSMHSDLAFADRARALGARGFIAKEDALSEIHAALAHPADRFYASASVRELARRRPADPVGNGAGILALTPTERRIMALLAESLTSREIAARLGTSFRTIQTHRSNIVEKLELHGANRLMELAIRYRDLLP
ncbi:MAG: response regulator transcription factor [Burkholderiaceae bacterium]|nr:response regulator transcription factor [Burkholderiaceae bacterium]